jgi:hypothetical protein
MRLVLEYETGSLVLIHPGISFPSNRDARCELEPPNGLEGSVRGSEYDESCSPKLQVQTMQEEGFAEDCANVRLN